MTLTSHHAPTSTEITSDGLLELLNVLGGNREADLDAVRLLRGEGPHEGYGRFPARADAHGVETGFAFQVARDRELVADREGRLPAHPEAAHLIVARVLRGLENGGVGVHDGLVGHGDPEVPNDELVLEPSRRGDLERHLALSDPEMGVVGVGAQLPDDRLNLIGVEAVEQDAEGLGVRCELEGARFLSADEIDVALE
jgi:hypothetical protein